MKNERCYLKNNQEKKIGFYIFPFIILTCLLFLQGAYYEKNIYYKLDDIELEIGEKIPQEIYNNLKVLGNDNYSIESNIPLNEMGETKKLGTYTYYLVYNDIDNLFSMLTNIKATINVVDTTKPTIVLKENNTFKYNSQISPSDIVDCYDLSGCKLSFKENIDTSISGEKNVSIVATDKGNNKSYINTKIIVLEKPKPVYNYYYSSDINYMNDINMKKNSLLTEEEKTNLRNEIVNFSKMFIGNPYIYGGTSLTNGTDCSGFTMSIYSNYGYLLPRSATSQMFIGNSISRSELLPGDLIVYHYGHVGIYTGNNMMIHAGTDQTGIVIAPIFEGEKSYRRVIY